MSSSSSAGGSRGRARAISRAQHRRASLLDGDAHHHRKGVCLCRAARQSATRAPFYISSRCLEIIPMSTRLASWKVVRRDERAASRLAETIPLKAYTWPYLLESRRLGLNRSLEDMGRSTSNPSFESLKCCSIRSMYPSATLQQVSSDLTYSILERQSGTLLMLNSHDQLREEC